MNALPTDELDVRSFLVDATEAATPALSTPQTDVVLGLGTRRVGRRRLAVAGGLAAAIAIAAIGLGSLTAGLRHDTGLLPARPSVTTSAGVTASGTVNLDLHSAVGVATTYTVSVFPTGNGGHVALSSGAWGSGEPFEPGRPMAGASAGTFLVILPADATTVSLLPSPETGVVTDGATRIPGTAWSVAGFSYQEVPAAPPTGALWFRADGTPVTRAGSGHVVRFSTWPVRVWLHEGAKVAGIAYRSSSAYGNVDRTSAVQDVQMSVDADAAAWFLGGYVKDTVTDLRLTPADRQHVGTVETHPIPGTRWTAFVVRVTTGGASVAGTLTWTGSDGRVHSAPA